MTNRLWKILVITAVSLGMFSVIVSVLAGPPSQGSVGNGETDQAGVPPTSAEVIGDDPDENGYAGAVVLAGAAQESSSNDEASLAGYAPASAEVSGDDPDESGYTGPIALSIASDASSAEEANAGGVPDWSQFFQEPQPDDNDYDHDLSPADISAADWSDFHYIFVAGSTLRPRASATTWASDGAGGCVYALSGGGQIFNVHLDIPNGSRLDYLRMYYYDTSASIITSTAWVSTYDGAGGLTDLVEVGSSGSAGYGTALSGLISRTVSTANNAYALNWRPILTGNTMRLCGLRVAYRLPN